MSGLTGWNPNPANLVATTAPRLCGAWWKQQPNPAATEGGNTTFDSQSTFVLPLQLGGGQTFFIYMGDRWNFKGPGSVRCITEAPPEPLLLSRSASSSPPKPAQCDAAHSVGVGGAGSSRGPTQCSASPRRHQVRFAGAMAGPAWGCAQRAV